MSGFKKLNYSEKYFDGIEITETSNKMDKYIHTIFPNVKKPGERKVQITKILSVDNNYLVGQIDDKNVGYLPLNEFSAYKDYFNKLNKEELINFFNDLIKTNGSFPVFITGIKNINTFYVSYLLFKNNEVYNTLKQQVKNFKNNESITFYLVKIISNINGGYICKLISNNNKMYQHIPIFMPGSVVGVNKVTNFDFYIGKEVYVAPINIENGIIIVSSREYLNNEILPLHIDTFKKSKNKDTLFKGKVTGVINTFNKKGIFCEFNIVNDSYLENNNFYVCTGLIEYNSLDKKYKTLFDENKINVGDDIEFYVKNIINPKKIELTQISSEITKNKNKKAINIK